MKREVTPKEERVLDKAREFSRTVRDRRKTRVGDGASWGDRVAGVDREDKARHELTEAAKELP